MDGAIWGTLGMWHDPGVPLAIPLDFLENLLDFLELRQVLSTYDGDLRDPLRWPQERPVPMRVVREPLGIPLPSMPGPKILCGVRAGTRAFTSSADMDLGVLLESPQGSQSSSRVGECTCAFLPS